MSATRIDRDWRAAHPLPSPDPGTDKNSRGRVLLVGGAEFVPGALRLTGEAALRAGAGKLQMATVDSAALALGVLVPEAAMIALPLDEAGEIAPSAAERLEEAVARCDTLILGPGMSENGGTAPLMERLLKVPRPELTVLLDAAAITCADALADGIARHDGRVVMTPHHGEMAALTGAPIEDIAAAPDAFAREVSARFGVVLVLKAGRTVIAAPDGAMLEFESDCVGLATGGSGDVLAGVIGGLLARGVAPLAAAGWGVWLHGEAGRLCAERIGPIGFLARDLSAWVPGLMAGAGSDGRAVSG
ncbi:MAG: NAD(P)H-hydrate dehydratase [Sphingobium sp.]